MTRPRIENSTDAAHHDSAVPVRLVIFDMDDVLLRYDVAARLSALSAMTGLPTDEIERRLWDSGIESASDRGDLDPDAYIAATAQALGVPFSPADWLRTRGSAMTPDTAMTALVEGLRGRVRLALLTNNGIIMKQHFDVLVPHLRPLFGSAMHVAAEFNTTKPDPSIYTALADCHGVAPAEAVMIDDKKVNVEGARAAGLRAHWFRGREGLEIFLRDLPLA